MLSVRPILDAGDEVEVEETEIRLDKLVYLLLREFGISIEILVGIVDEIKDFLTHSALEDILLGKLAHMQIISFLNHHRNLGVLLRHLIRHHNLELHVFVIHLETLQSLDVLRIVSVIVDGRHGAELVESPDEHTLRVHIGKSKRTYHILHAFLAAIFLNGIQKSLRNLTVVDEVNPSESDGFLSPLAVCLMVDDSSNATCQLSILIGKIILCLAELERSVLILAQGIHFVAEKIRHIVFVAFVEVVVEVDERLQILLVFDLFNFN